MTAAAGFLLLCVGVPELVAQRPFRMDDPLYRDESARRTFFDGFALSAKLAYRPAGTLTASGSTPLFSMAAAQEGYEAGRTNVTASPVGGLGLAFHLEYQVAPQLDLSVIFDALGGSPGGMVSLSWVSVKQYWHHEGTDYAVRIAFDPRLSPTGGALGIRQIDVAGLLTTPLGRDMNLDLTAGVRRVRIGYERLITESPGQAVVVGVSPPTNTDVAFTRASGQEVHLQSQWNYFLDDALSHAFLALMYEGGRYDLVENYLSAVLGGAGRSDRSSFWGHVTRVRTGVRWNRPSYQVSPFLSVPVLEWKRGNDLLDGQGRQRILLGLRLTLR